MAKFLAWIAIVFAAIIIAGLYGILHDQLTYSISEEYYTKFKFIQFGLADEARALHLPQPRLSVAIVGVKATWWMGIPIGLILGFAGAAQLKTPKQMLRVTLIAMLITLVVAFITGLVGLVHGYTLAETGVDWWLPENLVDTTHFIVVGSMHNFSYMGGVFGLLAGIIYIYVKKSDRPAKTVPQK